MTPYRCWPTLESTAAEYENRVRPHTSLYRSERGPKSPETNRSHENDGRLSLSSVLPPNPPACHACAINSQNLSRSSFGVLTAHGNPQGYVHRGPPTPLSKVSPPASAGFDRNRLLVAHHVRYARPALARLRSPDEITLSKLPSQQQTDRTTRRRPRLHSTS